MLKENNENIEPYKINISSVDSILSQKEQTAQKFIKLYDRLGLKNPEHVIIETKSLLEDIGKVDLGRILKMEYTQEEDKRTMLIERQKWNLSIRTGSFPHLRLIKYVNNNSETYDFEIPNQNDEILNEFLDLIKDRCNEYGIF